MITYKKWKPDTCSCMIREGYNSDTDTFFLDSIIKTCDEHSGLTDVSLFNAVKDQNIRKNFGRNAILTELSTLVGETKEDGSFDFKNGISVSWSWAGKDADRILTLNVSGITLNTSQRNRVQNRADQMFGSNKVIITNG